MNLGFFLYVGASFEKVEKKLNAIKNALGVKSDHKVCILRPSLNSFVVLSHCEDVKDEEAFYKSDTSLFFYGGSVFPELSSNCIEGTSFVKPDALLNELRNLEYSSAAKKNKGNFGACNLNFDKKGSRIDVKLWSDPFGVYPIFYSHTGSELVVSNFAEAIIACGVNHHELCMDVIAGYLATGLVTPDKCFSTNVERLVANSVLAFSYPANSLKIHSGPNPWLKDTSNAPVGELAEELYNHLRNAIKIRARNYSSPIVLKLSGGMDSRYLLHHLLTEKIPIKALTYRYNDVPGFDSVLPQQLADQLKFNHEVIDTSYKVFDSDLENSILGAGRSSSRIRKGIFSGTFAGASVKCGPYLSYEGNIKSAKKLLSKVDIFQKNPIDDIVENYQTNIEKINGENFAHKYRKWHMQIHNIGFMSWLKDIELCRPSFFFRGTRHMPYCDIDIIDLANRFPANLDPKDLYSYAFDHWMPEMKKIPMQSVSESSSPLLCDEDQQQSLIQQHQCKRLNEMFRENPAFRDWFGRLPPEEMPNKFRTFLYNFGAWQSRFLPVS